MPLRHLLLAVIVSLLLWALIALAACAVARADPGSFRSPWAPVSCANDPRLLAAGAAGVYSPTLGTIVLRPYVCAGLARLQQGEVTEGSALALLTLSHELAHASGVRDEREAECYGWRIMGSVGRHIEAPARAVAVARRMMARVAACG